MTSHLRILLVCVTALTVAACGGGGESVASIAPPPPPPPSPPPPPQSGTIFASPTPGEYASAGSSTQDLYDGEFPAVGIMSSTDADQPHIRYTADGYYEMQLPGQGWARLVPASSPPGSNFHTASGNGFFSIQEARNAGYQYSELARWGGSGRFGSVAFGVPTVAVQVPVTGSASYHGIVSGASDVVNFNGFDGYYRVSVNGSVNLNFNFAQGSLTGAITLNLDDYEPTSLGTFAFRDTVFSVGSTTYSGQFETNAPGQNYFLGRFTGPNAQETIGAWALPFVFPGDGQNHQAFGAWIAKQ